MVRATLASMRRYCPDVPVCLVADGGVDVRDLQETYSLQILRTDQLADPRMRAVCYGSQCAKLAAIWAGPFEHFVWLDADAIVWGDLAPQVRCDLDFQIFWSEISVPADAKEIPAWMEHYYFDLPELLKFDPGFEWRGLPYFSTGAFACRRNAITFQEWLEVSGWQESAAAPIFRFGEQGQLEYMVHSKAQRRDIKVDWTDLQHIWGHHGTAELEADCAGAGWHFPDRIKRPRVAHFCGQKPYLHNRRAYSRPFTIARLEHHRRKHGEVAAWAEVLKEEAGVIANKIRKRLAPKSA